MKPAVLETLMICPWPRAFIVLPAAPARISTALIITSMPYSCAAVSSVGQRLRDAEAGVVHQQVDGLLGAAQPGGDLEHLVAYAEVGREGLHGDAVLVLELGGELGQPVRVAGDQDEVVTPGGELTGELRPDARGATGDQRGCHGVQASGAPQETQNSLPFGSCSAVRAAGTRYTRGQSVWATSSCGGLAGDGQLLVGRDDRDRDRRAVGGDDPGLPRCAPSLRSGSTASPSPSSPSTTAARNVAAVLADAGGEDQHVEPAQDAPGRRRRSA